MKIDNKKFFPIYILNIINWLSFSLLIPVYPLLIKQYWEPAIVLWIFTAIFSFFQMFWWTIMWSLSDKYWRRPILVLTQLWTFFSWLIIAIAYFVPDKSFLWIVSIPILVIFLSRAIDGITWWNESVANAYVSDISNKEERTIVFWYISAIFWFTLIVWTWLWAFSMASNYWYLWTAIMGAFFSFIALIYIIYKLKESLPEEKRNKEIKLNFKELNIISQINKWIKKDIYKWLFIMKLFVFSIFSMYVTTFSLYIIDVYKFDPINIWYYLSFTWMFIIINQWFVIKRIIAKIWESNSMLLWIILVSLWFLWMWFSKNIYLFTVVYYFVNLWFTSLMTITQWMLSKNASEKEQWEIMGISSSLSAFIFIYWPVLWWLLYWFNHEYFYYTLWSLMIFSFISYFKFIKK